MYILSFWLYFYIKKQSFTGVIFQHFEDSFSFEIRLIIKRWRFRNTHFTAFYFPAIFRDAFVSACLWFFNLAFVQTVLVMKGPINHKSSNFVTFFGATCLSATAYVSCFKLGVYTTVYTTQKSIALFAHADWLARRWLTM